MLSALLFVIGFSVGSFISALTYRFPRNISVAKGRSMCPKCKRQIEWYDNIPLLSFLILGGKCRHCQKAISWRYPLIELSTALGFLLIFQRFYPDFLTIAYCLIIFCLLLTIFVIDLEHQIIPDDFVFFGVGIALIYLILNTSHPILFPSLFSGFLAASLLLLIHLFTFGKGMGLGDVKFAVLGGMITGLELMPVWLFASFLTGGVVGIILVLGKGAKLKDKIAFGPFLIVGLFIAIICGKELWGLLL